MAQCPLGTAITNHQYLMQIAFDQYVTGEWYFLIYDETSLSYVLSPDYISMITGTASTYHNLGVFLEGQTESVDGNYIPNQQQGFTSLVYWDSTTNYDWTSTPNIFKSTGTGNVPPSNVGAGWQWSSTSPQYLTQAYWYLSY